MHSKIWTQKQLLRVWFFWTFCNNKNNIEQESWAMKWLQRSRKTYFCFCWISQGRNHKMKDHRWMVKPSESVCWCAKMRWPSAFGEWMKIRKEFARRSEISIHWSITEHWYTKLIEVVKFKLALNWPFKICAAYFDDRPSQTHGKSMFLLVSLHSISKQ